MLKDCWSDGQLTLCRKTLDSRDLGAVGLHGERHAALHGLTVEMHRAGTAVARVAADMGTGQPEVVADEVHQQAPRGDLQLDLLPVDLERDHVAPSRCCRSDH